MSEAKEEGVHPGHVTFIGSVLRGTYGSGGIAEVTVNAWKIKNQDWKDKRSFGLVLSSWDSGSCGSRVQEAIGHQRVERRGTSVGCGRSRGRRRDDGCETCGLDGRQDSPVFVGRTGAEIVVAVRDRSWTKKTTRRCGLRGTCGARRRFRVRMSSFRVEGEEESGGRPGRCGLRGTCGSCGHKDFAVFVGRKGRKAIPGARSGVDVVAVRDGRRRRRRDGCGLRGTCGSSGHQDFEGSTGRERDLVVVAVRDG